MENTAKKTGTGRHRRRKAPWKSPFWCAWLVLSLVLSAWMTVQMPQKATRQASQQAQTQQMAKSRDLVPNVVKNAVPHASDPSAPIAKKHARAPHGERTTLQKLEQRGLLFARLFALVGLGAMLGSIIEGRRWYRVLAKSLGRLTRAARLPDIVGYAMPAALASSAAADSMLVASHNRGEISASALIAGGMLNSFLAHFSHSMRVAYPVIAAIGLPGLLYFVIQFFGGALIIACVLFWNRLTHRKAPESSTKGNEFDEGTSAVLPWKETLQKGVFRALSLLFRLACISIPLILAMEWVIRSGLLDFWDRLVPAAISRHFPEELLTITAAQMGGLISSATVSASLIAQGLITGPQVLLAMLISSAVGNPVRTLRRNLPTALGIFPPKIACIIVFGMQLSRLLVMVAGAAILVAWMQAQG